MEDVERLLALLGKLTVIDELEDTLRWAVTREGLFSFKSWHMALKPQIIELFHWNLVWLPCGQPKVCLFHFQSGLGVRFLALTCSRRGVVLVNLCFPAKRMRRSWITFSFIVRRGGHCGSYCSVFLEFGGLIEVQFGNL